MSIPKPESKLARFVKSNLPWDILSALAAVGTGAASAYKFLSTDVAVDSYSHAWGKGVAIGTAVTLLSQVAKAGIAYRQQNGKSSIHDLAGCLHTLNGVVLAGEADAGLRSTVHVPDGNELIQALDYVSDARKRSGAGRKFSVNCGVIGKAFRERAVFCGARTTDTYEDFLSQMVKAYGMTEEQAKALDPHTRSWIAAPILSGSAVEGVLYSDSVKRDFFTDQRQSAIVYGSVAIAYFVGLRYS